MASKMEEIKMDTTEIMKRIVSLPNEIYELSKWLVDVTNRILVEKEFINNWKAEQMRNITATNDDTSKPAYGNDAKRNSELNLRMNTDLNFCTRLKTLQSLELEESLKKIEIERLSGTFKAYRAVLDFLGGK